MIKSPYPYFGNKLKAAPEIWRRFGAVTSYVEPFFGSGAVLLNRPSSINLAHSVINDRCGYVVNFWRAVKSSPAEVARWAVHPKAELDLTARHHWLVQQIASLPERLQTDPNYFCAQTAGWWCWGLSCWLGSGFCDGRGPWRIDPETGLLARMPRSTTGGIVRKLPVVAGTGINRQIPAVLGKGITRKIVAPSQLEGVTQYLRTLSQQLEESLVLCGDWTRACTPAVMRLSAKKTQLIGVLLDPPYDGFENYYSSKGEGNLSHAVREWAISAAAEHPSLRIAVCGYDAPEFDFPPGWSKYSWVGSTGYAKKQNCNRFKETIWFSPGCLP